MKNQKKRMKRRWYQSSNDEDRELFELCLMYFIVMLAVFIWALFDQNSHNSQISIAFFCLMVFLWFVIRRNDVVQMFKNSKAVYNKSFKADYKEKVDALILLCGLLAVISVLFVINLDILSNTDVRIGAVAAFGLYTALIAVWNSFKKN
jgi:uncharacterized ion transporter superfamily protein YfcC